jgi:hypothetical protein
MKYILLFLLLSPCCVKAQIKTLDTPTNKIRTVKAYTFYHGKSVYAYVKQRFYKSWILIPLDTKCDSISNDRWKDEKWFIVKRGKCVYIKPDSVLCKPVFTTKFIPESASYSEVEPGNEPDDHPFRGFGDLFYDFYGLSQAYDRTYTKIKDTSWLTTNDPRITILTPFKLNFFDLYVLKIRVDSTITTGPDNCVYAKGMPCTLLKVKVIDVLYAPFNKIIPEYLLVPTKQVPMFVTTHEYVITTRPTTGHDYLGFTRMLPDECGDRKHEFFHRDAYMTAIESCGKHGSKDYFETFIQKHQ